MQDQAAEANAAHVKRRLAKHARGLNFHARMMSCVVGSRTCAQRWPARTCAAAPTYWRALRRLSGVAGTLLRNGLMSSPPRRV